MRNRLFYLLDSGLPRWVALSPYQLALMITRLYLRKSWPRLRVWNRNSTRDGSFVMGVSDLDLTVLAEGQIDLPLLQAKLRHLKRLFPFLGEANFYQREDLDRIFRIMNPCELARDPGLGDLAPARTMTPIDGVVFLIRMLMADVANLEARPKERVAKWQRHADLAGIKLQEKLSPEAVIRMIGSLLVDPGKIVGGLEDWLAKWRAGTYREYQTALAPGFLVAVPHRHLWFERSPQEDLALVGGLTPEERLVTLGQIDWEEWGLSTQRHWLQGPSVERHLGRLLELRGLLRGPAAGNGP